jgi:FHA domain
VIVLLPPTAKSRVAGLWEAVDDGAGFDEVLDALISGGLRELPGFVLVSGEGREVKVVIRGAGSAELTTSDGPVTVSGSEETTWVEQNITGVTGLRVQVAEGSGAAYTVETGLVRVASVEHPAGGALAGVPDAEAFAVPVSAPVEAPERPRRILPPDPQLETPEPPAPEPAVPEPAVSPPVAPIPGAPVPVPGPLGGPSFDPLTSPDLAVTPHDLIETHAGGMAPPQGDGDDSSPGTPVARLIFSSGEVVDVDRVLVVGRAPDAGRVGGEEQVRLVTVPSPHQEISSTHVEIRPGTGADQGSAVVTDLGSTNGTVAVQPGLPAEDLQPGVAVQLIPGATIDLGEGVTIQVERGRSD